MLHYIIVGYVLIVCLGSIGAIAGAIIDGFDGGWPWGWGDD